MRWTKEEINYLEDSWGTVTVKYLATKLNRTETAIRLKAERLQLSSCYTAAGDLSANEVSKILGVDIHAVTDCWMPHGLKATKKALIERESWFINLDDLMKWLKNNQDRWDSRRVELFALGTEPEWLKEKRKKDQSIPIKRFQKWTKEEDNFLVTYIKMGKTKKEIAKLLKRSVYAVKRRTSRLKQEGILPKKVLLPWTKEENEIMFKMDKQGKTDAEIAWELGREAYQIVDHRRNLKKVGEYPGESKTEFIISSQMKKIIELKERGVPQKEIAARFNLHPSTIYRRLKKIDL